MRSILEVLGKGFIPHGEDGGIHFRYKEKLPDEVLVMDSSDFCTDQWCNNGSKCFGSHLTELALDIVYDENIPHFCIDDVYENCFQYLSYKKLPQLKTFLKNLNNNIESMGLEGKITDLLEIPSMNDNSGISLKGLAYLWNKTWSDMGYKMPKSALEL